jgi:hypothetical protein
MCIGLLSSTENSAATDRRTLADISVLIDFWMSASAISPKSRNALDGITGS